MEEVELDPEDIEVERPHLEGKTYIYDPDEELEEEYEEEEDIAFDPERRRRRRRAVARARPRRRRLPRLRAYARRLARPFRRLRPRRTWLSKFGYGLTAFLAFWFMGLHGVNIRVKLGTGEFSKWILDPIWQFKDALAIITNPAKGLESRFKRLIDMPIGISALIGGLVVGFIPVKFWGKGMLAKLLIITGAFTIAGQLLDPSSNGESDSYTPPFGIGETSTVSGYDPFKTAFA